MPCNHPLFCVYHGHTSTGKPKPTPLKNGADIRALIDNGATSFSYKWDDGNLIEYPAYALFSIPCGKCTGCRLDHSRSWADRLMLEMLYHDSAYFVTLTYDPKHLPCNYSVCDSETGEVIPSPTLVLSDVQNFMKDLRYHYASDKIRYYAAGEYGDEYHRPHYHLIIFGLHLDDLKEHHKNFKGDQFYTSDKLQNKVWKKGFVTISDVTWDTCAYTARYVLKKWNGDLADFYSDNDILPEFSTMSRKPGIAKQYFLDHPDCIKKGEIIIGNSEGGRKLRPPRYYDALYDVLDHDSMEQIKRSRKRRTVMSIKAKLSKTSMTLPEYQKMCEEKLLNRTKILFSRRLES